MFPLWLLKYLPNMAAAHISMAFNCQGPNNTVVTACVAGTQAAQGEDRQRQPGDHLGEGRPAQGAPLRVAEGRLDGAE